MIVDSMGDEREKTNIEVFLDTWRRLNSLKRGPGDSFDDVINRLIDNYIEEDGLEHDDTE